MTSRTPWGMLSDPELRGGSRAALLCTWEIGTLEGKRERKAPGLKNRDGQDQWAHMACHSLKNTLRERKAKMLRMWKIMQTRHVCNLHCGAS